MAKRTKDEFTRDWIIENSVEILSRYEPGVLTIRALHYQLVSIGMTNTLQHYKRVVAAMEVARWDGLNRSKKGFLTVVFEEKGNPNSVRLFTQTELERFKPYPLDIQVA